MVKHCCEYCGTEKNYKSPSLVKRFCSHKCSNRWKWEHVLNRAKTIKLLCKNCGKDFYVPESQYRVRIKTGNVLFCSRDCYLLYVKTKNIKCASCGKLFCPKKHNQKYCCHDCSNDHIKKLGLRKKHGFWYENGYRVVYENGHEIKEHILVMEKKLGRKLTTDEVVHHIDGNKTNNNPNNLLVMNRGEHSRLHRIAEKESGKHFFVKNQEKTV